MLVVVQMLQTFTFPVFIKVESACRLTPFASLEDTSLEPHQLARDCPQRSVSIADHIAKKAFHVEEGLPFSVIAPSLLCCARQDTNDLLTQTAWKWERRNQSFESCQPVSNNPLKAE